MAGDKSKKTLVPDWYAAGIGYIWRPYAQAATAPLHRIKDVEAIRARFIAEGVFVRPLGNVIYLTPAFTIRPTISRY
jgi:adenosylmethionine-8-amino-7-oxononanoate aminotransferase